MGDILFAVLGLLVLCSPIIIIVCIVLIVKKSKNENNFECGNCGNKINTSNAFCPSCGYEIIWDNKNSFKNLNEPQSTLSIAGCICAVLAVLLGPVILDILGIIFGCCGYNEENKNKYSHKASITAIIISIIHIIVAILVYRYK